VSIVMMGLCLTCATARAEDDVLKKMRDFKALMDTLPESTSEEDVVEKALPSQPAVATELPKTEMEADRPQWLAEPEAMEEESVQEPDFPEDVNESDTPPWRAYEDMDEYDTDEQDTAADVEESADVIMENRPFATETMDEDGPADFAGPDMADEESGYEWDEDIVEMEMDEDTKQTAQEIKTMLETEITAEVTGEDDVREDEMEEMIEEDEPGLNLGPDQVVEQMLPQDDGMDKTKPAAMDMAEEVAEGDAGLNIAESQVVLDEDSVISEATESQLMDEGSAVAGEQKTIAATTPGMESDAFSDDPSAEIPMNAQELPDPEDLDVLQYRQDLSQRLTGDMLDRNTHIERIKSEVDAEINEIQSDIEMITGARMEDSN
ncbi:MAG: hypothetical protein K8I00_05570, partial [Candidatus Omnitrophica bacterium]|nr:hypothetical protein [Candidatus Omnitrophota bacterium]